MMVVVSYDVSTVDAAGRRRLRTVADLCKSFGQRVQNSVFECVLDPAEWTNLRSRLLRIFEPEEDSLRFYFLGRDWRRRREHHGLQKALDVDEPLVI